MSNPFETFGKYTLLEKIASGGMAEVYLSNLKAAGGVNKFVGIKRILPQFSENQDFINMFKEEAKIAVNLNHSNIVSIFDFGIEKKQFYLVMEFVEGKNLRQLLNDLKKQGQYFSLEQIVYIVKEASAGLDHAHRCIDGSTGKPLNISHRDMSPQNIMISYEGEVKIIDFGIAKAETQLEATRAGTLKGKFGYMSPEQADGYPVDSRTDIFSLGIVLWELLANTRLFSGSSEPEILRKIKECQIPSLRKINPNIPIELEKIVLKALVKDKNLRYQTAAALHRDLNRFLNTQFPEFSTHDFSIFIKTVLAQYYQSQRKKMIEFANQAFGEIPAPVKKESNPKSNEADLYEQVSESVAFSNVSKTEMDKVEESSISSISSSAPRPQPMDSNHDLKSRTNKSATFENTNWQNRSGGKSNATKTSSSFYFIPIILILFGVYFINKKYKMPEILQQMRLGSTASVKVIIESDQPDTEIQIVSAKGETKNATTISSTKNKNSYELDYEQDYKVNFSKKGFQSNTLSLPLRKEYESQFTAGVIQKNISIKNSNQVYAINIKMIPEETPDSSIKLSLQSEPPGAFISVNNKKIDGQTPQMISVSETEEFSITLSKPGYESYTTFLKPEDKVNTLSVPLLKSSEVGYFKLSTPLGGDSIQLLIQAKVHNTIYSQKLNFKGRGPYEFTVPAGIKVNISGVNPYNGAVGSVEEMVNPQSRKAIELFLESR